jgi:DNA polymerase III delta subunit
VWRAGKLDALIEAVGVIKECQPLPPAVAVSWVLQRCAKRVNALMERAAAELLVEKIGVDLARLDSEIRKLHAAAGNGQPITAALVAEFVGESREEEAWKIQQTLLTGHPDAGLAHLRYLLDVSKRHSFQIAWSVTDLARKLHAASRARRNNQRPDVVASKLKLWGDSKTMVLDAAAKVDPQDALRLLEACVEAGVREKTGVGDIDRGLERLVIEFSRVIATPRGR